MAKDTIIQSIIDFFKSCPLIGAEDGNADVVADNLKSDIPGYCIETVPCNPIVAQYVDGSAQMQYLFVFASREYFGANEENLENSKFFENVAEWISQQNYVGNLPALSKQKEAQKIDVLTNGYVIDNDEKKARYQMQCRLKYYNPNGGK